MNPIAVIGFIVAIVVGYFAFTGGDGVGGGGPIATGPGTSEIQNPQPIAKSRSAPARPGRSQRSAPPPSGPLAPPPGMSPYADLVRITTLQRSDPKPDKEYVVLQYASGGGSFFDRNSQRLPIHVTGWTIKTAQTGQAAIIPRAFNIPEVDASEQDIFLPPGGKLIIVSGTPGYQRNFRENSCVGYFNQSFSFTPSLSNSCPDPHPGRSALIDLGFSGVCIDFLDRVPACRAPTVGFAQSNIGQECVDYIRENFNYTGCVKNFRSDPSFFKNTWRVYLGLPRKLYDPRHDRVTLRDRNGLLVDEFEY